jgi:aspartate carbamoyltransferase catalytic subunit
MAPSLFDRDLISIKGLTKTEIESVMEESEKMFALLQGKRRLPNLQNKIMATLFYEPSTRTRLSFESAMQRLGGGVIGFSDPTSSSAMKGESLADTIKVVSSYADIIVIRHNEQGAAQKAAEFSNVPVINAGDGVGQHPTQALLDLFTIKKEKGKLEGLKIAMVGDLKNGRTVHSLAYALGLFGNRITFIAPEEIQMPRAILDDLDKVYGIEIEKSNNLEAASDADIVYMTRIQKERFSRPEDFSAFANSYTVDKDFLDKSNDEIIIMHPLPRLSEISSEIDGTKNSAYFRQAAYGVPVRMAILNMMLNDETA